MDLRQSKKTNPFIVDSNILFLYFLTPIEYAIYIYLKSQKSCREYGRVKQSGLTIAKNMGIGKNQVFEALKYFKRIELLIIDKNYSTGKAARQFIMRDFECAKWIYDGFKHIKETEHPDIKLNSDLRMILRPILTP